MKASPLKLQNHFKDLDTYDTSEQVATGSTHVTTIEGVSSIKKRGTDKPSVCLIPHSRLFKTVRKVMIALKFIRGCKRFQRYFVRTLRPKQELMVKVGLETLNTQRQMDENALLDCGATGLFMDMKWAKGNFISMTELEYLIHVYNMDGSQNSVGSITHEATLIMIHKGHREKVTFEICDLGKVNLIIGYTWLKKHNPEINWTTGEIEFMRCPPECNMAKLEKRKAAHKARAFKYKASVEEVDDDEDEERAFFEEGSHLLRKLESDKIKLVPIQEELDPRHIYEMVDR